MKQTTIGRLKKHNRHPILMVSLLSCFLQFTILFILFHPMLTIDDYLAEISLSQLYFGKDIDYYLFVSPVLVKILGVLYQTIKYYPWLSAYLIICIVVSNFCIQYGIIKACSSMLHDGICIGLGLYYVLFFVCFISNSYKLSYTSITGICAAASICSLLTSIFHKNKTTFYFCSGILMIMSFLLRYEAALVGLCFWVLAVLVILYVKRIDHTEFRARNIVIIVVSALGCVLILISNFVKDENAIRLNKWNDGRTSLHDYHMMTYDTEPEFFESIGWNKEFYNLTNAWYLLDDKCDTEHYSLIQEYIDSRFNNKSIPETIDYFAQTFTQLSGSSEFILLLFVLIYGLLCGIRLIKEKREILFFVFILLGFCGLICMFMYLSFIGRMAPHVFSLCVACDLCLTIMLTLIIKNRLKKEDSIQPQENLLRNIFLINALCSIPIIVSIILRLLNRDELFWIAVSISVIIISILLYKKKRILPAVFLLSVVLCGLQFKSSVSTMRYYKNKQIDRQEIMQYISENTDDIYISADFYEPIYVSEVYSSEHSMLNLFYGFDYLMFSDAFYNKLSENALSTIKVETLLDDNVYYIGKKDNDEAISAIMDYLKTIYDDRIKVQLVYPFETDLSVYKFMFV